MRLGPLVSRMGKERMGFLMSAPTREDLLTLAEFMEAGRLAPVLDRSFPLDEAAQAFRHFQDGHPLGKIILTP